jgi:hypothetical protein
MIRMAPGLAVMLILVGGAALPASAAERLSGEEIRQLFEGNTVSGRYNNGKPFSEFHHKDGRATGHNRNVLNRDACWTTTQEAVCYYYGPHATRRTYCFTVERSGQLYVLRTQREGRINGVATIEPGDRQRHTEKVPAWNCDGLISRRPDGRVRLAER